MNESNQPFCGSYWMMIFSIQKSIFHDLPSNPLLLYCSLDTVGLTKVPGDVRGHFRSQSNHLASGTDVMSAPSTAFS
jgi:hypothetical protein